MLFFGKKKNKKREPSKVEIVVKENGTNAITECYNRLRDNILYLNTDGNTKVIQIESSLEHEGKTTILTNLAVSLGYTDKKVVVLELDFRRPRTHRAFGLSKDNGIAEYVLGVSKKEDIIKHTTYKNVDIITRGAEIYNASSVLVSDKLKNLIKELRDKYDYVLLDCAPVLQVSDYIHISKISDGILFVVAYRITLKTQVAEAFKELNKNGAKVLGTVFSRYDRKKDGNYGYRYHHKYYSIYSGPYSSDNTPNDKK